MHAGMDQTKGEWLLWDAQSPRTELVPGKSPASQCTEGGGGDGPRPLHKTEQIQYSRQQESSWKVGVYCMQWLCIILSLPAFCTVSVTVVCM